MSNPRTPTAVNTLFSTLHERAKELSCLYRIEEILSIYDVPLEEVFRQVVEAVPPGWQYPDCCQAQITYGSDIFESPDYEETPYTHCADIRVQDATVGRLCVSYKKPTPESDCGPFMKGEIKLIQSISERIGHFILHQRLRSMYEEISDERRAAASGKQGWRIDLEENTFTTKDIHDLLREVGHDFPALTKVFSIYKDGLLQRPMGLATDLDRADSVVTFDGLITGSPFMLQLEAILKTLSAAMGVPVDIEFASTGTDFYLLQCRPQSQAADDVAMEIPTNLPDGQVLFTAKKHVSNGRVADITHIVYVDPDRYGDLADLADLVAVGQAVGKLNKILPRRQFILMGPGRWGSRGDIKLGVRVTYSEINNSAMLIEVARKKGNYVPDVSFGTHFFQDLVESGIRYLPLYPDDEGIKFNDRFLAASPNKLAEMCPECAGLTEALKVIDVLEATGGKVLRVVMNADLGAAVGYFSAPEAIVRTACPAAGPMSREDEDQYRWRSRMAERIAFFLGAPKWGVRGIYLVDPSDGGEADPCSPIRMVLQFTGNGRQRKELETWLQGWSLSLAEMNYFRTGFHSDGLLDIQILTDEKIRGERDVAERVQLGADIVRELPLGSKSI